MMNSVVIKIQWLSGIESFVSERDNFIFNSFKNVKPVKRLQNMSDVFEQEHSGCVRDDLFDV